jgi:uroporphyrinogen decarboxylase
MTRIRKAAETMTARERVLRTFHLEKTDRVTIGYHANPGIHKRLGDALGCGDDEMLHQALGVDYVGVSADYTGPMLFKTLPDRRTNRVMGFNTRWIEHQTGGYWDTCDFPLQGADPDTIANFPVPNPDDFDYSAVGERLDAAKHYAVFIGNPGTGCVINTTGRLMGMEDALCNLMTEDEATLYQLNRRMDMTLAVLERTLDRYKGRFDFLWIGEDLGTQHAPMISLELYRKVLKPIHKRFADLAKTCGLPVISHTCGSSSWVYEDFIEIGISAVDTLQPEAAGMSPEYLKKAFGGRLSFRGCISTAGPLAYGTPEETRNRCQDTLRIMMDGYGYHFAPTHAIQDNTPIENVIAMYQAAHDFGVY